LDICQKTVHELGEMLESGGISSLEITEAFLERSIHHNEELKAFITITGDMAHSQAREADRRRAAGEGCTPLTGIPIALKDNICVKEAPCTCGSRILESFRPPYQAGVTERLLRDGAVIAGKTNMDEFAMGSSTENSAFFTTRNPWDLTRVPGGSSGGSAAAVAASLVPCALGSDTGGSVRLPAAFCGITGLKPTYGLISRYGLVAYASSLDQIGILSRDVRDCSIILNTIAGHDRRDSTSAETPSADYRKSLSTPVSGLRLGIPAEFFSDSLDCSIAAVIENALGVFRELGIETVPVSLPHIGYSLASYYIIAPAEASSNLARYDGTRYGYREADCEDMVSMSRTSRRHGFGAEVKRRIMLGTYTLSAGYYDAYYLKAQKIRTLIRRDFEEAFRKCDMIAAPTAPGPAFRIGENTDDPLKMYLADIFTVSVNLAGLPGLVIPCGSTEGLPVGLQLIGRAFGEETLLPAGHAFQRETSFHRERPPFAKGAETL